MKQRSRVIQPSMGIMTEIGVVLKSEAINNKRGEQKIYMYSEYIGLQ